MTIVDGCSAASGSQPKPSTTSRPQDLTTSFSGAFPARIAILDRTSSNRITVCDVYQPGTPVLD